jgi:hypothetical protein
MCVFFLFFFKVRGEYPSHLKHPFRLPEKEIIPNGFEVVAAVLALGKDIDVGLCRNYKDPNR